MRLVTKPPSAAEAVRGAARGRVLIADDETDLAESVAYPLRKRGYQVDIFRGGIQAAGEALARPYDLYFLDVLMPGMKGLELCRLLREDWRMRDKPILVASALGGLLPREAVLQAGADDYIRKPFSMAAVIRQMEIWLERPRPAFPAIAFRRFGLDLERSELLIGPQRASLGEMELALAKALVFLPAGRWMSLERVYSLLWAAGLSATPAKVNRALAELKAKLTPPAQEASILEIHPERGILFNPD